MAPYAPAVGACTAILLATLGGCDDPAKRESASLLAAVEQYRRADNGARVERAQAVVAAACTVADVCFAKQACLAAISPTVRALTLKDAVAQRLADIEAQRESPDASTTADLPAKLDEAERLLNEGHAQMAGCETALADLARRHGG
jgi:hypothetical protein